MGGKAEIREKRKIRNEGCKAENYCLFIKKIV